MIDDTVPAKRHVYDANHGKFVEKKQAAKFIQGPLSYEWVTRAAHISGKSASLALAFLYLSGVQKSSSIKLAPRIFDDFSIRPKTVYRLLKKMEQAKLITIENRPGKVPIVTLLKHSIIFS